MVHCLEEPQRGFCELVLVMLFFLTGGFYVSGLLFFSTGTPRLLLRHVKVSTSSELYPGYIQLLYFLPDFSVTVLLRALRCWMGIFYPQAFFTLRSFIDIFDTFCDSDAGRNTPSRILLCACTHGVVPSGWRIDLNYSYCSYKTTDLSAASVSYEVLS